MNEKEQEKLEQHDPSGGEVNPKWAQQFEAMATTLGKAIAASISPTARVVEPAPVAIEEPCSPEEARKLDELLGSDFYKVGESGRPIGGTLYRLVHWTQQWGHSFSESAPGMAPFRAMAFVETFKFVDRPTNGRIRGINNREEKAREILCSGFTDARQFLKTHVATVRQLTEAELQAL